MSGEWTFLSNHGHVLVCLARDPGARMRDVAEAVGITERAVQQIVGDLVAQGYLMKDKVGRRNRYQIRRTAHFRHDLEAHVTLGEFIGLVVDAGDAPELAGGADGAARVEVSPHHPGVDGRSRR